MPTDDNAQDENLTGERHFVATTTELEDDQRVVIDVQGREIAVFNHAGSFHAVGNFCPHQGGPIAEGMLSGTLKENSDGRLVLCQEGEVLSCPWHGWEFDITSGDHLAHSQHRLPRYTVEIDGGKVFVRL
jgi:nitrite reductase/ring-hydroxylating ferredoxin subunit